MLFISYRLLCWCLFSFRILTISLSFESLKVTCVFDFLWTAPNVSIISFQLFYNNVLRCGFFVFILFAICWAPWIRGLMYHIIFFGNFYLLSPSETPLIFILKFFNHFWYFMFLLLSFFLCFILYIFYPPTSNHFILTISSILYEILDKPKISNSQLSSVSRNYKVINTHFVSLIYKSMSDKYYLDYLWVFWYLILIISFFPNSYLLSWVVIFYWMLNILTINCRDSEWHYVSSEKKFFFSWLELE